MADRSPERRGEEGGRREEKEAGKEEKGEERAANPANPAG